MKQILWTSLILGFLSVGCAHKKIATDQVAKKDGVVTIWADWVKPKTKKFDLHFHIKNESDKTIIVMLRDMGCMRGEKVGQVKYTFFNTGEKTIDIGPGMDKHANMVCVLGMEAKGDFKVTLARVYENPSNDGKTPGEVMAKDIKWVQPDTTTRH